MKKENFIHIIPISVVLIAMLIIIGFVPSSTQAKRFYRYYYFAADSTEIETEDEENQVVTEKYKRSKRPVTKEEDRYSDPFTNRKRSPLLSLPNPSIIQLQVDLDSGDNYTVYEKMGDGYFRSPNSLTFEEFSKIQEQRYFKNYIKSKAAGLDGESVVGTKRLIPKIYVSPAFDRIFGGSYIDIRPNGFATLDFGAKFQRVDNPTIPLRQQRNGGFSFDQQLSTNFVGKIGEKATITANWDTKSSFQFENNIKFDYTGFEEDIIKKIEAGNVSLPINNSLIQGSQNLFGIKTQLQFGKLWVTSIASTQRSKTEGIKINGGVQNKDFEIRVDNYEENKHFFLSHFFRDNYEKALNSIPNPTSGVTVTRVEVYIINRVNNVETIRNLVGFTDLGEGNVAKLVNKNPSSLSPIPGPASNDANNLFQTLLAQPAIRNVDQVNGILENTLGMVKGTDFERITGARRLTDREFKFQPQLGYISLNMPLRNDEGLAVSYEYTYRGQTYKVGELTEDYQNLDPNQVLILKLLRPNAIRTDLPIWDLSMKNIYSINAGGINRQNFQLRIIYKDDITGIDNPSLHEGIRMKDIPLLEIMKLDRLNPNNDPQKDGNFDWVEGITVDPTNGRIIFPVLEPFGSYLTTNKWLDPVAESNLIEKYVFNEIYRKTKNDASLTANKNKFFLKGSFQSNSSSEIRLGFAPAQGSVSITAGNTLLTEGVDFLVDYDQGVVRIINEGVKNSGKEINVRYEKPDFFNFQTRTLVGSRFDYKVDKDLTLGGTVLYLNERPTLTRVNIGDEPMRNTMWGLDVNYRRESKGITNIINKLPFLRTKEISTIAFTGEFAQLIPKTSPIAKGNSYLDDFETSEIGIDLTGQVSNWKLAGTPQSFNQGSAANPLAYTYKRAKLAWYNIDNLFYGGATRPKNITDEDIANQYVRSVIPQEVFRGKARQQINTPQQIFDIAYYPSERGPYNYNTDLTNDGKLKDPKTNWGGITRAFTNDIDFDNANVEYIEFWVMDPFIQGNRGIVQDGVENKNNTTGGKLYFNLGSISEDVLKDGRHSFENGLPIDGNVNNTQATPWARVPTKPYLNDVFENTPGARIFQDIGWDGLNDADEGSFFQVPFLSKITNVNGDALTKIQQDPSGDNFEYYLGNDKDAANQKVLERYKNFNGLQGNSPENQPGLSFFPSSTTIPDNEDLNRDNTVNDLEAYYEYEIDLKPGQLEVGKNNIVDKVEGDGATWYQFRVPIREYKNKVGAINGFKTIRFLRMYLTEFEQPVVLRFFQFHMVSTTWRKFTGDLVEKGLTKPLEPYNPSFVTSIVGIEKNSVAKPGKTAYVVPPGVQRDIDVTANFNRSLNEQSIQLCVEDLKDRDARAVFKNTNFDLINYGRVRLYIHAETYESTNDYETTAFLRLGTDFTDNYYEIEVPLKITANGTSTADPYGIWPDENEINFALEQLYLTKSQRNANQVPLSQPYSSFIDKYKVTVVGNPDLSSVQLIMIGIRNPKSDDQQPKSVCIWVDELRATDFNQTAGWASTARLNAKLADFATVTSSARYTSFGFGSIQDKISQRTRDYTLQYDVSSNIAVDKLLPQKAGLKIPMFVSYDNKTITPKYNPFDPDVPLDISLKAIQNADLRQQYLENVQDKTTRRSINFTNVQKIKTGKNTKSHLYDVENLSFTYAYSDIHQSNLKIKNYLLQNYKGGVGYAFNSNAKFIEPFKKIKFLNNPYLKLIKDFNFSLFPNTITVRGDLDRRFARTELRSSNQDLNASMAPFYEKYFTFTRNYEMRWNLAQSVALDYSSIAYSVVDEPDGDINTNQKQDSVLQNLKKLGRIKNFTQRVGANYRLPTDKIPLINWIKVETRYTATYTWTAGALGQSDTLGNLIKNTSEQGLNGKLDLISLYNKNKFLRESLNPPTKSAVVKKDTSKVKHRDLLLLKGFARLLMTVRSIDLTFTNRQETTLPGFIPVSDYFGMDKGFNAPGLPFILGSQDPSIRFKAADNGWLVKNENINNPFLQNITTSISARTSLEPFRDLKIQLDAKRNTTGSYQEIFRYDNKLGGFNSFNPSRTGSYSISFIGMRTLFVPTDAQNNSATFSKFDENRSIIRDRLQTDNPNQVGGTYDLNSQDVLIPSFIAAYSGTGASKVTLSPFQNFPLPNWRIDYAGLSKLGLFKKSISSINLTHSYVSSYNAGNFTSSLAYSSVPGLQIVDPYPFASQLNMNQNYIPLYILSQVILSDQFAPLIGVNVKTKNNITVRLDYKIDRMVGLNLSNAQVTETMNKEWVIGIGYITNSFKLPFRVEGRTVILKNDLNFRCDVAIRDSKTTLRKFETEPTVVNGNLSVQIRPTISYVVNQRLTLQGYFQRELNNPRASNAYKRINTAFGIQVRFSIAQ